MAQRRTGLPRWLRAILARLLSLVPERLLAMVLPPRIGFRVADVPLVVVAPATATRVYVGPVNSAGQAWQWTRAAERNLAGVGGISMANATNAFRFPVDYDVPLGVYRWSRGWQRRQERAVSDGFSHVVIESGKRLFGDVFPGSVTGEAARLQAAGIKIALLFHGSDIRLPSRHATSPWSPFRAGVWDLTPALEQVAASNARLVSALQVPVFVSTPDLLLDVPRATWLPVVVDVEAWLAEASPFSHGNRPRVSHVPSKAVVKGSDLVDPILGRLDDEGVIEYVRVAGVPAAEMPSLYTSVDIVLDQFRIGSYGVAACEAMAAGRIVVSHVDDQVRKHVKSDTGLDLPIVQATADDLEAVIRGIVAAPERYTTNAAAGVDFARAVHDGERSARALDTFLHSDERAG